MPLMLMLCAFNDSFRLFASCPLISTHSYDSTVHVLIVNAAYVPMCSTSHALWMS